MPLKIACDALQRGVCLDLLYRGEIICVEVHAAGYDLDAVPLVYGWQRVGFAGGRWCLLRMTEAQSIEDTGYFSEAPRPGYRLDGIISKIVCQV